MSVTDRVRRAVTRPAPVDSLVDRVESLRRFVSATEGHLPDERLAPARGVVARAGERLGLSRDHTVVALAGATGSGKSSLFNATAGVDISPAGVLRPTTGVAHAGVWGFSGARELLDWLDVPAARRHGADPDADPGLRGLVLLDLPDFDSVEESHRIEVDRLLELVDLVVWVLDPEKYADRVVHEQYLAQFRRHADITVVVLNKADRLSPADVDRCLVDLRRLLVEDGLTAVPVLATSTVAPPGTEPLRAQLEKAVAARLAALQRLSADVDGVVAGLEPLVSVDAPAEPDRATIRALTGAFAVAAGVPVVAAATQRAYVHRGVRTMGWPFSRWLRRLRADPLGRLRLGGGARADADGPTAVTSISPAAPAAEAAVGLALRTLAQRAGGGLPEPWPSAVLTAARSRTDDLSDSLDLAIARTDLGMARRPLWWHFVGAIQYLFVLAALVGLGWLAVRYALFALALPSPPTPEVGRLPMPTALFLGGLLGGLLLSILVRPVIRIAAGRKGRRAANRMRAAVDKVAQDLVIAPVRAVLRAYAEARAAWRAAR